MRIAAKMAASLAGLALLAIAAETWLDQHRRADLLAWSTQRDERMGRALRANAETLWRMGGEKLARLVVETTDDALPNRMFRFVRLQELEPPDLRDELARTREVAMRELPDESGIPMSYIYIPLAPEGGVRAAIVVGESLEPLDDHMRERLVSNAAVGVVIVGLSGLLAVLLGAWMVDRPIEALRQGMRALGEGQMPPSLPRAGRDELGSLARELQAVGERLAARERLRHADRLRTVGRLAAGVAHELGAPLTVVKVRAGMIARGEVTGEETTNNARIIMDQVDRVTALVRQLLDYSRRQSAQASGVEVGPLVANSLDVLEPLAGKRGVRLEFSPPAQRMIVRADPVQLQQVVTNLAMNGVEAMAEGGTLRVAVGRGTSPHAAGEWVWIRVSDDGPGIAPEHLPHVFEPFYTTKPVGEGTGLGLAVVQAIVDEHGGWIDVASEPGGGTQFTVYLAEGQEA